MLRFGKLVRSAQVACRRASTRLSQTPIWFQLANISQNGTTGSDSQLVGYPASWSLSNAEPHAKEPVMSNVRFIGLDVHAETIAVAVAEPDGEVRSLGVIPNRPESIQKLVKKLGPAERLRVCYEAGPTGDVVYWQLGSLGGRCAGGAPTLGVGRE